MKPREFFDKVALIRKLLGTDMITLNYSYYEIDYENTNMGKNFRY